MVSSASVPFIWLPLFHPAFPFTHLFFSLFFHVFLSSCLVISSFLSFAHTSVLALVCTCTSTCTLNNPGFRSPRFDNEVGFSVCLCALGSFSSQPHTRLSCPPFISSSFCPCCAHTCTFVLTLVFCLPSGRRVCNPWSHRDPVGLLLVACVFTAGGSGRSIGTATNEDAHLIWRYQSWPL